MKVHHVIYELDTDEHLDHARALLKLVFGGSPRIRREDHRLYGIYHYGELVAVTGVNVYTLGWFKTTAYAAALKAPPEGAISFTAVHPDHRQKGYATALRRYIQGVYRSLVTGTGAKSMREAMHRLNERTGFRVLWKSGKRTVWYWARGSARTPRTSSGRVRSES